MPKLSDHDSTRFVKILLLGDAKTGKTGSLVSLVAAGYRLRILDLDNLLDILRYQILKTCPERLDTVEFVSLRDNIKASPGGSKIDGKPKAWISAINMLNRWQDGDSDLGVPSTWGADTVLVLDGLTRFCKMAYDFHEVMTPRTKSGQEDGYAIYRNAQNDVEKQLSGLTSPSFETNVIVICHGKYMDMPDGTVKIFPEGIGKALSPIIPTYFPNFIHYKNDRGKRTISLKSDASISLSTSRPDQMPETLPIETGLADFFALLRDPPAKKPSAVTLRRV